MAGRDGAWLVLHAVMVSVLATGVAHAEDQCLSASAKKKITCDGVKLTPQAKRARVSYQAPNANAGDKPKALGPSDPTPVTKETPRIDRVLQKKGRELLLREIASVQKLYRATPKNSHEKPQLLRRLADNYAELESDLYREQIETAALAADVRRINPVRSNHLAKRAKDIASRVGKARKEAIVHYKRLADKHPAFCQSPSKKALADRGCTDQTLYYLAYEHELAKEYDEARDVYLRIINAWPKSKYVPHAYLAFGELYYNEAQGDPTRWPLAQKAYEEVAAFPAPANALFGYAHYKLAYVHWNQGAHALALEHFKKVIANGRQYPNLPNATGLMNAARRDIVPVYATTGQAEKAYAFFKPLSGDSAGSSEKTFAMLEDLGQALMDTGHYAQAKVLYTNLKKKNGGEASCRYQVSITKATMSLETGNKPPILDALDDQLAEYLNNRDGGYGERARLGCANHTAALLAETAMAWHLEAVGSGGVRGTGDKKTLDASAKLYAMVDDNFTHEQFAKFRFPHIVKEDWPTLATLRYHQADLLWERKRWSECGRAFHRAYEADPTGKHAAEALFTSGLCWQNAMLEAKGEAGYRATRGELTGSRAQYAPRAIEGEERAMLDAFDRYACKIEAPKGDAEAQENHCEVKFARARAYYEARHFQEAAIAFRDLALEHPTCEAGAFAGNLYLESLEVMRTKLDRHDCVEDMSADVPKLMKLYCDTDAQRRDNDGQCAVLARVNRDVARLDIERLVKSVKTGDRDAPKKLAAAGDRYWKMWEEHGAKVCVADTGAIAEACKGYDEVLHNAAAAYDGAHLLAKAMSVRKVLVSPKYQLNQTPVARQALFDLGANHQAIAVYDLAAQYYERFATENPKEKKAPTALSDAVVLRLGLGEAEEALADAKQFAGVYGSAEPANAAQIAFAIGAHHVQRGAWKNAEEALSRALKQIEAHATADIRVQTYALLGRVYDHLDKRRQADELYGKARAQATELAALKKNIDGIDETQSRRERRYGKLLTAVGEALHYFAEKERDKAEAIAFPRYSGGGSQADVDRFVKTKVLDWLGKKKPAIERATKAYMAIVHLNDTNPPPRWAIAAGAAVGDMWGSLVDDFMSAPYPKDWDQPGYVPGVSPPLLWAELKAIYVNTLADVVEPYQKVAKNAYLECLEYGLVYQHFDGELRSCERWLSSAYPAEFHLVDELAGVPTRVSSGLDERPLPLGIDGSPRLTRPQPAKQSRETSSPR